MSGFPAKTFRGNEPCTDDSTDEAASTISSSSDEVLHKKPLRFFDAPAEPVKFQATTSRTGIMDSVFKPSSMKLQSIQTFLNANQSSHQNAENLTPEDREACLNAPIFSSRIGNLLSKKLSELHTETKPTQIGLIGVEKQTLIPTQYSNKILKDSSIFANMDVPWSAFICGSQGAGKSHTLSCLLENGLLRNDTIGHLSHPLAAMLFHYDNYSATPHGQICEAAYLCSSGVPVTVLVSPSNIWNMTELYGNLPGLPSGAPAPKVLPLYLSEKCLNISVMLKLMSLDPNTDTVPLYMETVMGILREMAMEGPGANGFSYSEFRNRLDRVTWVPGQWNPLSLRLQLLESFLQPNAATRSTRPAASKEDIWTFEPGTMTIVDLSDPFVSSNDACSLFSICLSQFLEDRAKSGRIVALDEAHKFLLQSGEAKSLTNNLTAVIRQQRHTGTRVIISTQEPTLSPEIIDLANATFVHRFSSPAWYNMLKTHLAGAHKNDSTNDKRSLFETIVALQTGEALVFCPTAAIDLEETIEGTHKSLRKLGDGYIKIKVRGRVTADGGKSVLASMTGNQTRDQAKTQDIPMHVVSKTSQVTPGSIHKGGAPTSTVFQTKSTSATSQAPPPEAQAQMNATSQVKKSKPLASSKWVTKNKVDSTLKRRLRLETQEQVQAKFPKHESGVRPKISLRDLSVDVEHALDIPAGTLLRKNNSYGQVFQSTAQNEWAKRAGKSK